MRKLLILTALLGLTGCDRDPPRTANDLSPPPPASAPTPAAPVAAIQPLMARGNEPFWGADVGGDVLTLTRPDHPTSTTAVSASGPPDNVTWTGKGLSLLVRRVDCSDGMSDMRYPMSAELKLGAETLKGCAFFKADPPKQP